MKTRVINLTAHEARAFQRGATILVREVKPQPPSIEAVKKLSGSDYGWMDCSDMGRPSEFRVVGPEVIRNPKVWQLFYAAKLAGVELDWRKVGE